MNFANRRGAYSGVSCRAVGPPKFVRNLGEPAMRRRIVPKGSARIRKFRGPFWLLFGQAKSDKRKTWDAKTLNSGEATRLAYMTDEAKEGRNAFLEKRKPDFGDIKWIP